MLRVAPSWIETVKRIAATARAVGLLTVAATTAAHAEDSDQTRYYLLLKTLDTNPGTGDHDVEFVAKPERAGNLFVGCSTVDVVRDQR